MAPLMDRAARSFDYRLERLLSNEYYGNRRGWQRRIRQRRFRRAMTDLARCEPELARLLRHGLETFGMDPDRPNSRYSDALFLLDAVTAHRPARVLECGAGLSTLIFAYALDKLERRDGRRTEFISMDESADYIEHRVRPILPPPLRDRVRLMASPVGYWRFRNRNSGRVACGIGYAGLPQLDYDFIYVDGPQVRQGHYRGLKRMSDGDPPPPFLERKPFDCDAVNAAIFSRKQTVVVIDQRIDTRWQIRRLLDRPYRSTYHFAPRKSLFVIPAAAVAAIDAEPLDMTGAA
jgi:hypothetical protein